MAVVKEKGIYIPEKQALNVAAWLFALEKDETVPPDVVQLIADLKRLRNPVALDSNFEPDALAAQNYVLFAKKVLDPLNRAVRMASNIM